MSDDHYVERTTVSDDGRVHREEVRVRDGGSAAGWWVAALIAIVAIVGVVFMINANTNSDAELQAARDQGAAQAALANAAADAQSAAVQASQAAQSAMDSTARATEQAAVNAQAAAQTTADAAESTADAARDAAASEPLPQ